LFVDNADTATLTDDLKLPAQAKKAIRSYVTLRDRAEADAQRAAEAGPQHQRP
jgi:hypothetical protein